MTSPKALTFPQRIQPQLVAMVSRPPVGEWLYEVKYRWLSTDGQVQFKQRCATHQEWP